MMWRGPGPSSLVRLDVVIVTAHEVGGGGSEVRAAGWTEGAASEPGSKARLVEDVARRTGKPDDEALVVVVVEEGMHTDGAVAVLDGVANRRVCDESGVR